MGQQQLLLLVLGVVLVGLAVAVGIQAFGEQTRRADMDLVVDKAVDLAARLIAWEQTPRALGGGGNDDDLGTTVGLADLGVTTNGTAICSYAQNNGSTRGDNCLITPYGEFHVARGRTSWMQRGGIGYIHAISRYERRTFRVQIIRDNGGLHTNLDDIVNGRDALPMP